MSLLRRPSHLGASRIDLSTLQPAEFPDDTLVYVPGYGETTVGDIRAPLVQVPYNDPSELKAHAAKVLKRAMQPDW